LILSGIFLSFAMAVTMRGDRQRRFRRGCLDGPALGGSFGRVSPRSCEASPERRLAQAAGGGNRIPVGAAIAATIVERGSAWPQPVQGALDRPRRSGYAAAMTQTRLVLLAVVSADGFIARHPGEHPGAWASQAEQARFLRAVPRHDWAFMGRTTHETAWRADRRRVVFSRSATGLEWRHPTHLWVDPGRQPWPAILAELAKRRPPRRCAVLGGTAVHDWFLARGLLDRIDLSIEPLRFGQGLPLLSGQPAGPAEAHLMALGWRRLLERPLGEAGTRRLLLLPP
jgi:dihydrofolate reductase